VIIIKENTFRFESIDIVNLIDKINPYCEKLFPNWNNINTDKIKELQLNTEKYMYIYDLNINSFESMDAKLALNERPLLLEYGYFNGNVMYCPAWPENKNEPYVIKFGFQLDFLRSLKKVVISNDLSGIISIDDFKNFYTEKERLSLTISRNRLENALMHELTHWLDNSIHNEALRKNLSIRRLKSPIELNAQIHAIKIIKQRLINTWDNLTIFDLIAYDSSLKDTYHCWSDIDKKQAVDFVKRLMKQMEREGLLGKKMNFIPNNDMILLKEENAYYDSCNFSIKEYL